MVSVSPTERPKRTAASRVLSVLEAFKHCDGAPRLTDISRYADMPLPTAHRLVHELLDWGGLDVDEQGRYRLSRKFLELASISTRALRTRELAVPHLVDLHRRSGLTVMLGIRDARDILYLDAIRAHPSYSGQNRIGGRLPLHLTAAGLLLLASSSPEGIDRYASQPLQRYTEHSPANAEELRTIVKRVRRERCAVANQYLSEYAGSAAAPVVDIGGETVAAIGAVYVIGRDNPRAVVDLVRIAAKRVSNDLVAQTSRPNPRAAQFKRRRPAWG